VSEFLIGGGNPAAVKLQNLFKKPVFRIVAFIAVFCVAAAIFLIASAPRVSVTLYLKGKNIHGLDIEDAQQKRYVMDVIDDPEISEAKSGADVTCPDSYFCIYVQSGSLNSEGADYYVFEVDGTPYVQNGETLLCSVMRDDIYSRLKEIAYGYYQPYAMTVVSGDNTIKAAGHLLWHTDKVNGVSADMIYFEPSEIAESVEYITLDPENDDLPPFTPFVKGKEVNGKYTLYDQDFSKIPFGRSFKDLKQGKYILELETSFEDSESSFGMQYFFGVIVP
jgi:hypothetical protein